MVPGPRFVELLHPLQYNTPNLAKIAQASDPNASAIVVFPRHQYRRHDRRFRLLIDGLADQVLHHTRFLSREGEQPAAIPAVVLCTIDGPGVLSVYRDFQFVARLDHVAILKTVAHPLASGPIKRLLLARWGPDIYRGAAREAATLSKAKVIAPRIGERELARTYLGTVARFVSGIQRYGHGGALLLTPAASSETLRMKYRIDYQGVSGPLKRVCLSLVQRDLSLRRRGGLLHRLRGVPSRPGRIEHVLDTVEMGELAARTQDVARARTELDAALAFAAGLSRVDGAVVCDHSLYIYGFGAELVATEDPPALHIAADASGRKTSRGEITHFGQRHRSMIRYCWAVPGSVGFVVSQDGDIRIISRLDDRLVLWDRVDVRQLWLGASWT